MPGDRVARARIARGYKHVPHRSFPYARHLGSFGILCGLRCPTRDGFSPTTIAMPKIYVIHENDAWVEPLRGAFAELHLPFEEWFLSEGLLDLAAVPPEGVFYNRMSASSHTRGHRYAAELTAGVLAWLERYRRRVVNNSRALQLEVSKIAQYAALADHGIRTPRTIAAVGRDSMIAAARSVSAPFITKHNRAGKGLGVKLFQSADALAAHLASDAFEDSVDGITLIP